MRKHFIGMAFMGGALMLALAGCSNVGPQSPIPTSTASNSAQGNNSSSGTSRSSSAPTSTPSAENTPTSDVPTASTTEPPEPTSNPTNTPVNETNSQQSLQQYADSYTTFKNCDQGAVCVGQAGDIKVDCNTAQKPSSGALLTGYTIVYSDTAKMNPTAINCSWFTPEASGE